MLRSDSLSEATGLRVAITTLGCKVNQYDSTAIARALEQRGCAIVEFDQAADVYIVNSCTVTDRADAESKQLARRARRQNPKAKVIVTGCFAQVAPHRAAIPEVDAVIGLNRLDDLVQAVCKEIGAQILVNDLRTARKVRTVGAGAPLGHTRAFLKVQEGCDLFCSFCIVPMSRGASRSVPPRQVLEEYESLADAGVQEIVLTGVHLGAWGNDLSPRLELADLVEMLAERGRIPRLRLSSIDPPEVTPRLLRLLETVPELCPHFHIPIQAGVDSVLRRMRRRYDTAFVRSLVTEIRRQFPDAAIGTDIIAGFPGEDAAEFQQGLEFFESLPLTYFHVFPYSVRQGTTAAKLPGHLPPQVVHERARKVRALGSCKRETFARQFVGRELKVLIEERQRPGGYAAGYSRNYQRVFVSGLPPTNAEIAVRIVAQEEGRLLGVWTKQVA